jgi:hypothetical protein
MEWISVIGQHFYLAYHSSQVNVDNRTPLTSTNNSLDITPTSLVSATTFYVCKMLKIRPTNKLHTSLARLVNNQAACKRLIDSLITINPIKPSSPILIF